MLLLSLSHSIRVISSDVSYRPWSNRPLAVGTHVEVHVVFQEVRQGAGIQKLHAAQISVESNPYVLEGSYSRRYQAEHSLAALDQIVFQLCDTLSSRSVCILRESLLAAPESAVPFILTGVQTGRFFGIPAVHDVIHLYGYLCVEEEQLFGTIRLDSIEDVSALTDIFCVLKERSKCDSAAQLNNLLNQIRYDVELRSAVRCREK